LSTAAVLLALVAPWLLGAGLLRTCGVGLRRDPLGALGWSYFAGALGMAFLFWAWLLAGMPCGGRWLAAAAIAAGAVLVWLVPERDGAPAPLPRPRENLLLLGVVAALALLTLDRIAIADCFAIVSGDEANIWAAKAKLLVHARAFDADLAVEARHSVMQPAYPLLNPLLQIGVYAAAGETTHVASRLPMQLAVLAMLPAVAAGLRRHVRPAIAAVLLALLWMHDELRLATRQAIADPLVAAGLVVVLDVWLRWRATADPAWWRLCALALAFLVWTKNEGALLALVLAATIGASRVLGLLAPGRGRRHLLWLALPGGVLAAHWAFNEWLGFRDVFLDPGFSGSSFLGRLVEQAGPWAATVLAHTWEHALAGTSARGLLLALLALAALFPMRLAASAALVPGATVLGALGAYQIVFLATPHGVPFQLDTGGARIVFQLVPAAALALGAALAAVFPVLGAATACPSAAPDRR
jgi:hypothetical protein